MKKLLLNMLLIFKKKSLHIVIISSMCLGCVDNQEIIVSEPVPSTIDKLNALFEDALKGEKQTGNFIVAQGLTYTSPKGTKITIQPNSLSLNGVAATGTATFELIDIYDRAKMIVTNKPTMGLLPNKEWEMMQSGGEFYINITQNGQNLTPTKPIAVSLPAANTGGLVDGMRAFKGTITDNTLVWELTSGLELFVNTKSFSYDMSIPGFGWFNCDKFYNYPEPKTTITANVPKGFGSSSQVFLLTKNVPNALGTLRGKYPVGLQCYLIFVTENNGNFMWITKEQTLTANHTVNFELKDVQIGKKADYVAHVTLLK
jgi:hypothetical protein